ADARRPPRRRRGPPAPGRYRPRRRHRARRLRARGRYAARDGPLHRQPGPLRWPGPRLFPPSRTMTLKTVQADLAVRAPDLDVMVTEASTATVQLAAAVHGCAPGQIAKTLAIRVGDREFLLVTRGDARLSNQKAKAAFGGRPRMLGAEDVERLTSHKVGRVCPFGLPAPLPIVLDTSLKIYDLLIPPGGDTHASVRLDLARLAELGGSRWVDACQMPE